MYFTVGSVEYNKMFEALQSNRNKTSRDLLCTACWKLFTYTKYKQHLAMNPSHEGMKVCCQSYSDEESFLKLAQSLGRVKFSMGGQQEVECPLNEIQLRYYEINQKAIGLPQQQ